MDHYATLGVPPSADAARVREAYKRAALRAHPDRGTGDARAFLELKRAYDCLADATARKRYDAALASRRARPLAETIDAEELDAVCAPIGARGRGGGVGRRGRVRARVSVRRRVRDTGGRVAPIASRAARRVRVGVRWVFVANRRAIAADRGGRGARERARDARVTISARSISAAILAV